MARLLSRRPRAPTCDLPSRSCCAVSPCASLRSDRDRLRRFSALLSYFDAPDSLSAMAMAWRRLLTLPPCPPGPLLSSPCLNSCMTRPAVLRCRGDDLGMANLCCRFRRLPDRYNGQAARPVPAASPAAATPIYGLPEIGAQ